MYGIHSQGSVIQIDEGFSESRRAADVGRENSNSIRKQSLIVGTEGRCLLGFGSAVDAHNKRVRLQPGSRQVEPPREWYAIAGLIVDKLRAHEIVEIDARMSAERQLPEPPGL